MDLLTQGLAGALLASAGAKPDERRHAAIAGFAAGLLADADVLIRSSDDPLLFLEFHRHFTHALAFIPIGGLLAACLLWPFLRRRVGFARLCLFTLLGYAPSGLLDACTSYGTLLLWPFSETRVAWSVIAIVDPLFTLGLLVALLFALRRASALPARLGLAFALGYLALGYAQHQRAASAALELAAARGHAVERALVKPTLGNLLLWRSVYESAGRFHVDAIRVGLAPAARVVEGGTIARVGDAELERLAPAGTRLHGDLLRFARFSDGYVVRFPGRAGVLGDVRYANLPDALAPLWGITLPDDPSRHADYAFYRDASRATRDRFVALLFPDA